MSKLGEDKCFSVSVISKKTFHLIGIILLSFISIFAKEEVTRDFQTSISFVENYKINKSWEISAAENLNLHMNSKELKSFYTDAGITWSRSFLSLALGGRWTLDFTGDRDEHKIRLRADLGISEKFGWLKIAYRARFYNQNNITDGDKILTSNTARILKNRLKLSLPLRKHTKNKFWKKMAPYISIETTSRFMKLEDPEYRAVEGVFGSKIRWKKFTSTVIEWEIEREWQGFYPATYTNLGLTQEFNF